MGDSTANEALVAIVRLIDEVYERNRLDHVEPAMREIYRLARLGLDGKGPIARDNGLGVLPTHVDETE